MARQGQVKSIESLVPPKRPTQKRFVIDLTQDNQDVSAKVNISRKRKKIGDDDDPTEEKRLKRFRDRPPQTVLIKHQRVMSQRMFLVERSGQKDGELDEDFSVLGSTGNVYVVNLNQIPTYIVHLSE
jgi:hypothetical protein